MANERLRQEFRTGLISSSPMPVTPAVQTSTDNVKAEFGNICKSKYAEVTNDLKYMAQFHDLQAVFDALKQDFGLE
jgi:hypothetical protein